MSHEPTDPTDPTGERPDGDVFDDNDVAALAHASGVRYDPDGYLELPLDMADDPDSQGALSVYDRITREDLAALAAVEEQLDQRWPETKLEPSLTRITALVDLLGSPHLAYPVIQVAGTNGKTSTVRMIDALLTAFSRRTGRTTSPHLQLVTERIAVDNRPVHPRTYVEAWEDIRPYVELIDQRSLADGGVALSKFEVLTALSYAIFADTPVDVAVVETGMGGTWDATSVVTPQVSVITPIGLDHTDYLGETITEIATEKAGIIKSRWNTDDLLAPPDNVAVIAEQDPAALKVLLERAVEVDAAVARFGHEFGVIDRSVAVGGQQLTLQGLGGVYDDIFLPLHGAHQAANAAVALAAVEAFFGAGAGRSLDIHSVRAGFAAVSSPGRMERVKSAPTMFIDAAHNSHGARALGAALDSEFDFRRIIGVVGVLKEKDATGILEALEPYLDEVVVTAPVSPRALPVEELYTQALEIFGDDRVHRADSIADAIETATAVAEDGSDAGLVAGTGIIITGSVVTAGQARALSGKEPA